MLKYEVDQPVDRIWRQSGFVSGLLKLKVQVPHSLNHLV